MTVSFSIGWWLTPIVTIWVWLAAMFFSGHLHSTDMADFVGPFLMVTVMCLLTRFLP